MGRLGSALGTVSCFVLFAVVVVLVGAAPGALADNEAGGDEVVVAVLDTGVRASHETFDYADNGGQGDGPAGQLQAWWDFTDEKGDVELPDPGETWDQRWGPYDEHGHGTATASLAAGSGYGIAEGVDLAVGKVADGDGSVQNLQAGYEWAVKSAEADVVSISIGTITPWVGLFDGMDEQISWAREQGVLTVVSAGNGLGNACGPAFSWSHGYGYVPDALSVGSLFESGGTNVVVTCSSFDPDVASHGYDVPVAAHTGDSDSTTSSGTSFAAPNVAGAAAQLVETALAADRPTDPAAIEELVLSCADPGWPYHVSGAGFYYTDQHVEAEGHAQSGGTCPSAESTVGQAFETHGEVWRTAVAEPMKIAMTEVADDDHSWLLAPTGLDAGTGPGVIGTGAPAGPTELELYEVDLDVNDLVDVSVRYEEPIGPQADIDVGLFAPGALDDGILQARERVAWSANSGAQDERIRTQVPLSGTYLVGVWGWTTVEDQPVDVSLASEGSLAFLTEESALAQILI